MSFLPRHDLAELPPGMATASVRTFRPSAVGDALWRAIPVEVEFQLDPANARSWSLNGDPMRAPAASTTVCDVPVNAEPGPPLRADCCEPIDPRIARHFDRKMRHRVADGARPPLHAVSQRLLDALAGDATAAAPTVLEIGCGGGALSIGLLERGATSATGVDLSNESIEVARARAEAAGLTNRTRFEMGDGASVRLVPHDWVVLDRVLCCYPDLDRLLENSVSAAERRYAFSVPASSGWRGLANRIWFWLEDATESLRGRPCPGYVHDISRIEARLIDGGFRRTRSSVARLWYVAVFDRT